MEMQQTSWAIDKIWKGLLKFDMCFSYGDEDRGNLQWWPGTVIRILREARTYATVKIEWDKECFRDGDREVS
jgi:hypothetical protein